MRILFLSFYFEPDLSAGSFKNSALARELARRLPEGSEIQVITTLPNRYEQFSVAARQDEIRGNIRVHRISLPFHKSGMLDQSKAFFAYVIGVLRIVRGESFDLVYASSSRLMMSVLGAWISWGKSIPLYLDIRDLFVDTIKDVLPGKLTRLAMPVLSLLERCAVNRASRVNLVSAGFIPYFRRNYPDAQLAGFTNGIDQEFLDVAPMDIQVITRSVPEVLYAGNIGEGQGLHNIIPGLAKRFEGKLTFRIVGAGGRLQQLKDSLAQHGCTNVTIDLPVSRNDLINLYMNADILFLHLNDFDAFKKVLPSKIFEYGALGRPIWAGVGGFSAEFIRQNIPNSAVFSPCDVAAAVGSFSLLRLQIEPRNEFVRSYARGHIVESMSEDIMSVVSASPSS